MGTLQIVNAPDLIAFRQRHGRLVDIWTFPLIKSSRASATADGGKEAEALVALEHKVRLPPAAIDHEQGHLTGRHTESCQDLGYRGPRLHLEGDALVRVV